MLLTNNVLLLYYTDHYFAKKGIIKEMTYLETAIINIIIILGAAGISVSTLLLYAKEKFKSPVLVRS